MINIIFLIISIFFCISLVGSIIVMKRVKAKISPGQISQEPLTKDEKIKIWILALLNPIWAGLIFYFGWRKLLPIKAKKANIISFVAFIPWLLFFALTGFPNEIGTLPSGSDSLECNEYQDGVVKDICYSVLAENKQDLSICDKIQDAGKKDGCYSDIAKIKQDLSICDKIQGVDFKDYCYSKVAKAKQDSLICDTIQKESMKDGCYFDIAKTKQDISICDNIQDADYRDRCHNQF